MREISLANLSCTDHQFTFSHRLDVDLPRHFSLRKLTLCNLSLSVLIVNMASLESCWLEDLSNRDLELKCLNCADSENKNIFLRPSKIVRRQ